MELELLRLKEKIRRAPYRGQVYPLVAKELDVTIEHVHRLVRAEDISAIKAIKNAIANIDKTNEEALADVLR